MNKKFIIVQDEATANKLVANGFQIVYKINNTNTFINNVPQHISFDEVDKSKLAYTNMLRI